MSQLSEQRKQFAFCEGQVELVRAQVLLGRDHDVQGGHFLLMQAEECAQNTLDAVSGYGVTAFFGDSKPQTPMTDNSRIIGENDEIFREATLSSVVTGGIFRPAGDATLSGPRQRHGDIHVALLKRKMWAWLMPRPEHLLCLSGDPRIVGSTPLCYADRLLRPLARLRLITARPLGVLMRARKPWVRFLLILLG